MGYELTVFIAICSYGELGSMVIHQTLYNLFPPTSFHTPSIAPFTPSEFIQRILVPEAALRLIMEDTGQPPEEAIKTMRESAAYGVTMFPDGRRAGKYGDDVEGDVDGDADGGVGEDIVMERARARRAEVEMEDRVEERVLKEMGMFEDGMDGAARKKGKGKAKAKVGRPPKSAETTGGGAAAGSRGKKRKKGNENESATEAEVLRPAGNSSAPTSSAPRPPKPRPIPVTKRQKPTETTDVSEDDWDSARHSDASAATNASRRSRKPTSTSKASSPPPPPSTQPPQRSTRARSAYRELSSTDESEDDSSTLVPSSRRSIELSKTSERSKARAVTDSSEVEIIESAIADQTPRRKGPPRPRMIRKNSTLTDKDINGVRDSPEETPKAKSGIGKRKGSEQPGRLGEPSKTLHPLRAARARTAAKNEYVK